MRSFCSHFFLSIFRDKKMHKFYDAQQKVLAVNYLDGTFFPRHP